jgi:hypothetical protein
MTLNPPVVMLGQLRKLLFAELRARAFFSFQFWGAMTFNAAH